MMKLLRTRKRLVVLAVVVTLLLVVVPVAQAWPFGDVPVGYWAYNAIRRISYLNISGGCGGGNYCPEQNVTRAQMAGFLNNLTRAWTDQDEPYILNMDHRDIGFNRPAIIGQSNDGTGLEGYSYGAGVADYGVRGETNSTSSVDAGVWGNSTGAAMGVKGESATGWGGYLEGGQNNDPDLVLGGTSAADEDGNLWSHPGYPGSDILLFSNDEVHVHLDENNDEDGNFNVYTGDNALGLGVQDDGDVLVGGSNLYLHTRGGPGYIWATSQAASSMWLVSHDDVYVDLDNDNNTAGNCFYIRRDDNSTLWSACDAGVAAAAPMVMAVETNAGSREMYAMGSTELWFEDFGSADLVDGQAAVGIDALFAETVNLEAGYQVYLTPVSSEAVLLFVTAKTPTGFEVRGVTLDGKPASASFDYRIVAKRLGYEGLRLDEVDLQQAGDEALDDSASDPGPGTDEAPTVGESIVVEISPGEE